MNIALADYNEKARRDREKSAAAPFQASGDMGGGTLAAKVAGKIANDRERAANANESNEAAGVIAPANAVSATNTDADAPEWIDTSGEDAYLGEQAQARAEANAQAGDSRAGEDEDEDDKTTGKELPPMDTLLARIPAESREILEELFRARFVKVRKIPRKLIE